MSPPLASAQLQRSHGEAHVVLGHGPGRVRIKRLYQRGSAKAILPHVSDRPEVVFLNTSGGLAGGDRLDWRLDLDPGVKAVATSQTAERAYRSTGAPAEVRIDLHVGAGGWLDWLPQETIHYDGASLNRRSTLHLAKDAGCLTLEAVVLGREAMGETVRRLELRDWRQISRDGQVLLVDALKLVAPGLGAAAPDPLQTGPAGLGGNRAFAAIAMVGAGAMDALAPLRAVLDEPGVCSGASAFEGKLTCRMQAQAGWPLRRQIIRALSVLRRRELPRNWQTMERQI